MFSRIGVLKFLLGLKLLFFRVLQFLLGLRFLFFELHLQVRTTLELYPFRLFPGHLVKVTLV